MKVLIDGKEHKVLNDVKIIWEDEPILFGLDTDDEVDADLHLTATHEGIVVDVINKEGEVETTMSQSVSELSENAF